jgi:hypothetical protein
LSDWAAPINENIKSDGERETMITEWNKQIVEARKKVLELAARNCYRPLFQRRYNLIGERFGRLSVTKRAGDRYPGHGQWICVCDCGTEKVVAQASLVSGNTQSCGCLHREISSERVRELNRQKKLREVLHPE